MKNLLTKIENNAIANYGFENKKTIRVFKATDIIRKYVDKFGMM